VSVCTACAMKSDGDAVACIHTTSGPILIPCEGSGAPGNAIIAYVRGDGSRREVRSCQMCGSSFIVITGSGIPEHDRDDVISRLKRGDFG